MYLHVYLQKHCVSRKYSISISISNLQGKGKINFTIQPCIIIIVLLQEQCVQYWPSTGQEIWGTFVVSMAQEERVLPEYTVRKFNIRHIDNVSL